MLRQKKFLFLITTLFIGASLAVNYTVNADLGVNTQNGIGDITETAMMDESEHEKQPKEDLDVEVDTYTTTKIGEEELIEIRDREVRDMYISRLKEDERYVITYEPYERLGWVAMVEEEAGNGSVKIGTIDELIERLAKSDIDFYLPTYMPEGFELKSIDMGYYLSYDNFNLSATPIREEKLELKEGATAKIYKMQEDYKNNVAHIYLQYSDGKNIITYSFGLSGSSGYDNKQNSNQFVKEEFDYTFAEKNNLTIYQKITPKEHYGGLPAEEGETLPDYYGSIKMQIKMESEADELKQEEMIKIANGIYKVN